MDSQLRETVRRIAKEITSKNNISKSWNGIERRKLKRMEAHLELNSSRHLIVCDRREIRSVFTKTYDEDFEKSDVVASALTNSKIKKS